MTAAPAGSSGNFALGGHDPARGRDYVMYQISGGGYGGNAGHDGLSNGCSTIGISKSPPVEIMEQAYPVLYRQYALREGSGGAGKQRGGFGLAYEIELLRGEARASFVMDHGRFGPQGALGGADGAVNSVTVFRDGEPHVPPHLSKEQDIPLKAGDRVLVGTPGGGGYGDPFLRDPELVLRDVALGYYTREQAAEMFGVVIGDVGVDIEATDATAAAKLVTARRRHPGRHRSDRPPLTHLTREGRVLAHDETLTQSRPGRANVPSPYQGVPDEVRDAPRFRDALAAWRYPTTRPSSPKR